jgi:hypothetical protein
MIIGHHLIAIGCFLKIAIMVYQSIAIGQSGKDFPEFKMLDPMSQSWTLSIRRAFFRDSRFHPHVGSK